MEFSSTQTYANRYDLDEIDVFLEGDSSNPMFFSVTGIDKQFNFGKHYFNLSLLNSNNQKYKLRENSRILFEFKSINNVVLKSYHLLLVGFESNQIIFLLCLLI